MTVADDVFHAFPNSADMIRALAGEIVSRLTDGVSARGAASLVVSGGTTPGDLFDSLSTQSVPWDKVWITLSDERWVAPDRDESNERLVRTRLLKGAAAAAKLVPLKTTDASPDAAKAKVDTAISAMPRPFDVVLLGMGDDGHTASLFPRAAGLGTALDATRPDLVQAVHAEHASATSDRISLTLRAILDSKLVVLLVRGDAKRDAYRKAAAGTDALEAPVRAVLHQSQTPVRVYWSP